MPIKIGPVPSLNKMLCILGFLKQSRAGLTLPALADSTALGKSLLAFLSDAEREMLIKDRLFSRHTENTITTMRRGNLDRTVRNGYVLDDDENELGIRCIGVPSVSADGQPVASLRSAGPVHRITPGNIQALAADCIKSAATISEILLKSSRKIVVMADGHKSVAG
jgi:DNA-binding IclR family transcriptional regulator